jgi:hypothetical protein
MRKYFPIYEEAVSHLYLCNCSILNFLIYEENLIFFFISVQHASRNGSASQYKERGRGATATGASRTADAAVGPGGGGPTIRIRQTCRNEGGGGGWPDGRPHGSATFETAVTASGAVSIWKLLATTTTRGVAIEAGPDPAATSEGAGGPATPTRKTLAFKRNLLNTFFFLNSFVFCFLF